MHYLKAMEKLDLQNPNYKALTRSSREEKLKKEPWASQDSLLDEKTL
jgi:hypothetical protein